MTFAQSLNVFADRVLDRTLRAVEAGACVPSNGQECACINKPTTTCGLQGKQTVVDYSCLGQCKTINMAVCC